MSLVIVGLLKSLVILSLVFIILWMWFIRCVVRSEWLFSLKKLLLMLMCVKLRILVNKLYNIFFCGVFGFWLLIDVLKLGVGSVFWLSLLLGVNGSLFIFINVVGII